MIRRAQSRDDLAVCAAIKNVVDPHDPVTVDQLADAPGALLLHGADGYAYVDRSSIPKNAFAMVRVRPESRRRGVGSALVVAAAEKARGLGAEAMWGRISELDEESLQFAARRGFEEVTRDIEVLLEVHHGDGAVGDGIVELREEHLRGAYAVAAECIPEMAVPDRAEAPPFDEWLEREDRLSAVAFVALDGREVVGYARLYRLPASPRRLENGLTAVRRGHRRRGIATALKRAEIAWAAEHGYRELVIDGRRQRRDARGQRAARLPAAARVDHRARAYAVIELHRVETDAELDAWRRVRMAVLPNERTASVEEMRRSWTPEQFMALAFLDGVLAGSGAAGRSDMNGQGFVAPRVLPSHRRRGVGTVMLRALAQHVESVGFEQAGSSVEDEGSLAFAQTFGFHEVGRQVEQVRAVGADEPDPRVPDGIELVSLAGRPDLRTRTYHELALQAFEDMPTPSRVEISIEDWEREWVTWPEGSFVALAGGELVGCAGLIRDDDHPDRAENSLTAVRRDWRGRGVARALKQAAIAWASANGLRELYTWTQTGNEGMRTVNEKLGYVTRDVSISVRAPLPLHDA